MIPIGHRGGSDWIACPRTPDSINSNSHTTSPQSRRATSKLMVTEAEL